MKKLVYEILNSTWKRAIEDWEDFKGLTDNPYARAYRHRRRIEAAQSILRREFPVEKNPREIQPKITREVEMKKLHLVFWIASLEAHPEGWTPAPSQSPIINEWGGGLSPRRQSDGEAAILAAIMEAFRLHYLKAGIIPDEMDIETLRQLWWDTDCPTAKKEIVGAAYKWLLKEEGRLPYMTFEGRQWLKALSEMWDSGPERDHRLCKDTTCERCLA